jgi:aspartate dehydrogenase
MKKQQKKIKIGFIGCGAIGSRLAISVKKELKNSCSIAGFYDVDIQKILTLIQTLRLPRRLIKKSLNDLIRSCDFIVEAIASTQTTTIIRKVVQAKKGILIMSVGKILNAQNILALAKKNQTPVLIPSGAISGLDVIKSVGAENISNITLTTRKPLLGINQSEYLTKKGIFVDSIKCDTVIFDGSVDQAVKLFPRNINVAATIAIASGVKQRIRIRIVTSPHFRLNTHEIEVYGKFGHLTAKTDNVICPDNPKTSYLAVLSATQTLKQFFNPLKIGT